MSWNWGTSAAGANLGYQAGSQIGGPWGGAIGAVIGGIGGGLGFGGDPGMPIASPLAGLSDAEYGYYTSNILPLQKNMINKLYGPTATSDAVNQAQADVNTSFANLPGAFKRNLTGRGIVATPQQTAEFQRQSNLNKGIATTAASNAAARGIANAQAQAGGA